MKLWLIVPVKPFNEGKSRLSRALQPAQRAELSARLLAQTLSTAQHSARFDQSVGVSRDPAVLAAARTAAALGLPEAGTELNTALAQACAYAGQAGAQAALLLPADLPRLADTDLHQLVDSFVNLQTAVLAPSRDGGTSALLLRLPPPFALCFGPESFHCHRTQALAAGCSVTVVDTPSLRFDLDSPAELAELQIRPARLTGR